MEEVKYEDYQSMIYHQAWRQKRLNPSLEMEELVAQGNLAFCEAAKTFDAEKGKFSTWLYHHFKHYVWKAPQEEKNFSFHKDSSTKPNTNLYDWLYSLSQEAHEMAMAILKSPAEFTDCTKERLTKYFLDQGWSWKRVRLTFKELKKEVKNL